MEAITITISVVIPAFNDAAMLEAALAALRDQSRTADEIIVVDNASTDATGAVARAANVRVVFEAVRGIWPAAAAGYDAASGDVIARLDADSLPPRDWLTQIEAAFTRYAELGAITGPGTFYGCNPVVATLGEKLYLGGYFWAVGWWLGHPPLFGSNFAMRREVWREARMRVHRDRGDIHDDLDLSFNLARDVIVAYHPALRVAVSARPFASWSGLRRRLSWAGRTFALQGPDAMPFRRRAIARASR